MSMRDVAEERRKILATVVLFRFFQQAGAILFFAHRREDMPAPASQFKGGGTTKTTGTARNHDCFSHRLTSPPVSASQCATIIPVGSTRCAPQSQTNPGPSCPHSARP